MWFSPRSPLKLYKHVTIAITWIILYNSVSLFFFIFSFVCRHLENLVRSSDTLGYSNLRQCALCEFTALSRALSRLRMYSGGTHIWIFCSVLISSLSGAERTGSPPPARRQHRFVFIFLSISRAGTRHGERESHGASQTGARTRTLLNRSQLCVIGDPLWTVEQFVSPYFCEFHQSACDRERRRGARARAPLKQYRMCATAYHESRARIGAKRFVAIWFFELERSTLWKWTLH